MPWKSRAKPTPGRGRNVQRMYRILIEGQPLDPNDSLEGETGAPTLPERMLVAQRRREPR